LANLYLLFSKALQNYVITMKSGEETTFVMTLLMSLLNCYGLVRGGNLLEVVVVMGGMVARWASLLVTRDGLPALVKIGGGFSLDRGWWQHKGE
jgi:hypothetical protein